MISSKSKNSFLKIQNFDINDLRKKILLGNFQIQQASSCLKAEKFSTNNEYELLISNQIFDKKK